MHEEQSYSPLAVLLLCGVIVMTIAVCIAGWILLTGGGDGKTVLQFIIDPAPLPTPTPITQSYFH